MTTETLPYLMTVTGEIMPLESLAISGNLEGSVANLELTQIYRNRESVNIEAVYTFPLPFDGVLLGLQAKLGERILEGVVMGRESAEEGYEDAITDGDSAILLEQHSPGLYTINLGNLLPDEVAELKIQYALPLKWAEKQLRLALPLTVAPRYGRSIMRTLKPFAEPESDCIIEYALTVHLIIHGALAGAAIHSPTHELVCEHQSNHCTVSLKNAAGHPDRDLVLVLADEAPANSYVQVQSDSRHFGHAVFSLPAAEAQGKVVAKLLIDCSGSMAGASIAVARRATDYLIHELDAGDQFTLTAFGSTFSHSDEGRVYAATGEGLPVTAAQWIQNIDANLGGTEMESALRAVFALTVCELTSSVLMITDGEIWNIDAVVVASRAAGQRVFIIGVGLSPAESNLRLLAESTGGAVEFVSPAETVDAAVDRQLRRMRQQPLQRVELNFTATPCWMVPNLESSAVFAGETLHCWYELSERHSADTLTLSYQRADGKQDLIHACAEPAPSDTSDFIRQVVAARLKAWDLHEADDEEIASYTAMATEHQLVTSRTSYLMVHRRAGDQAFDLPVTRQVKHMQVVHSLACNMVSERASVPFYRSSQSLMLRRVSREIEPETDDNRSNCPDDAEVVNLYYKLHKSLPLSISGIDALESLHLTDEVLNALQELVNDGVEEESVLLAFWKAILNTPLKSRLKRRVKWWIKRCRPLNARESWLSMEMTVALGLSDKYRLRWDDAGAAARRQLSFDYKSSAQ